MKSDEYQYLTDTMAGRRARDPQFEVQLRSVVDPRAAERQRQLDSLTPEQREIEQRRYSLRTYGREHMKRYATPIISEKPLGGELGIEGDQIAPPAQLKGHNGGETSWQDANGRLKLQVHSAIRQSLQLY
jgi:hypothetical protein